MGVKIDFDSAGNVISPTFVLTTRGGVKIGYVHASKAVLKESMSDLSEIKFGVNKVDCGTYQRNKKKRKIWNELKDFKLLWAKQWNKLYEIYIDLDDSDGIKKSVTAKSLGECELSQLRLYDVEINTESDVERDDYQRSVLYNKDNPHASILHRILNKAPHYTIGHVDYSISNIQRSFSFTDISIRDALIEVSKEIDCYVEYNCYFNSEYKIVREVNVYDLQSYCLDCKTRGNYFDVCDKCGSGNITPGYGEDTTIYISKKNLADNIKFTTDTESVKNTFKLVGGDDLMTATIINCNPNGSDTIISLNSNDMEDMSPQLVERVRDYNTDYEYYYSDYEFPLDSVIIEKYNALVDKYSTEEHAFIKIPTSIIGYANLMKFMYEQIDFRLYLENELMPESVIQTTSSKDQLDKLNAFNYTPVSVKDLDRCSVTVATNSVMSFASILIDSKYKISSSDVSFSNGIWTGKITATNYSNEEDTSTSDTISVTVNDDYENFLQQKIKKSLNKSSSQITSIVDVFGLNDDEFCAELRKYGLSLLNNFHQACQACLNILIEQGVMNSESTLLNGVTVYNSLYMPLFNKLNLIAEEIQVRDSEIAIISGTYNVSGEITYRGVEMILEEERNKIQKILDFENYLGSELWMEFILYRREDTYRNSNYISDGLTNSELIKNALEFLDVAKQEAYKASNLQHSISAPLNNLLVMKEFEPIVNHFKIGNWLKINVDGTLFKLRLIDYEVDFDNLDVLNVEFSDVMLANNSTFDLKDIIQGVKSITSSYDSTKRQAGQGEKSNEWLESWVTDGLSLTQMKIIDNAENQNIEITENGIILREHIPEFDSYDEHQIKIINNGLYFTSDAWNTSSAGIGMFYYYDPVTRKETQEFGVIANTLVGNLILSKKVGIYNSDSSITLDNNGFTLTSDYSSDKEDRNVFVIQKRYVDTNGVESYNKQMYLDDDGGLVLNGTVGVYTGSGITGLTDLSNDVRIELTNALDRTNNSLRDELKKTATTITEKYDANVEELHYIINDYKAEVGQYMTFGNNGLTLGATSSPYKTVIDNRGLYFKQEDLIISYIANSQLYIPSAVIESTLTLGNFFFSPRDDGSFSLTWQS